MSQVTQNPNQQTNGHKCASCGNTTTAKRMNGKERWHDIGRGKFLCENCYRKQRKEGKITAGKRGRKAGSTQPVNGNGRKTNDQNDTQNINEKTIIDKVLAEVKAQLDAQQKGRVPPTETKQTETKPGRPDKETVEQARAAKEKIASILNQKRISDVQKIRDILNVVQGTTT